MYSFQLELNSYDYVNTCNIAPGYVHVLCGQAVCYSFDMHTHIQILTTLLDYFTVSSLTFPLPYLFQS